MTTNVDEKTLKRLLKTHTNAETADILGVSRATIQRAIKIYGIEKSYREVIDSIEISESAYNVLYGSLLGDGHIEYNDSINSEAYYRAEQGASQKDYLYWKYDRLKKLCKSEPKACKRNGEVTSYYFQTRCHKDITTLYQKFYTNGSKHIPRGFEFDINSEILAVWYFDDGTYNHHSELCVQGFTRVDIGRVVSTLKLKFDIDCNAVYRSCGSINIQFSKRGTKALHDLIRPYVIPSMEYKLYPCNDYVRTPKLVRLQKKKRLGEDIV